MDDITAVFMRKTGFLEEAASMQQKKEGVTWEDSVETLRVDLRTIVKKLGAKEKAKRKKCKVRKNNLSRIKKKTAGFLPKNRKIEHRTTKKRESRGKSIRGC